MRQQSMQHILKANAASRVHQAVSQDVSEAKLFSKSWHHAEFTVITDNIKLYHKGISESKERFGNSGALAVGRDGMYNRSFQA